MDWVRWITYGQLFLLIFARCYALVVSAPLLSSQAVPRIARIGLALFCAAAMLPGVIETGYQGPQSLGIYVLYLIGETLIGVTLGLLMEILFSAFLLAGQFFSMQMGFSASQVFDPLAQMEIPLMGQFLNLMAMFLFLTVDGFQKLFLTTMSQGFGRVSMAVLLSRREEILPLVIDTSGSLFHQALLLALPIMGILFLMSVTMGLLAKAAPQMNLLMLGFPINITIAFLVIILALPYLFEAFSVVIDGAFQTLRTFMALGTPG